MLTKKGHMNNERRQLECLWFSIVEHPNYWTVLYSSCSRLLMIRGQIKQSNIADGDKQSEPHFASKFQAPPPQLIVCKW